MRPECYLMIGHDEKCDFQAKRGRWEMLKGGTTPPGGASASPSISFDGAGITPENSPMHASVRGLMTPSPRSPLPLQARASGQTSSQPQTSVEAGEETVTTLPVNRRVKPPPMSCLPKKRETTSSHEDGTARSCKTPRSGEKIDAIPPTRRTVSSPVIGKTSENKKEHTPRKSNR